MSDIGIKEKIQKIRQELTNFSLSDQNSLDIYKHTLEPGHQDCESSSIINLALPEDSKLSPIMLSSQKFLNRDYLFKTHSEAELKEAIHDPSLKTDPQMFQSLKEQELSKHNRKLLANLHETRAYYIQVLAEKDDLIAKYREKIHKDEHDMRSLRQGCLNIEDLKDSTRKILTESDKIEREKSSLYQENKTLKEKLFKVEEEFRNIRTNFESMQDKFKELNAKNSKSLTKIEELKKENEFLYKALNQGKKFGRNSSLSPMKGSGLSSRFSRSNLVSKKVVFGSDGERTERKSASPLLRSGKRSLSRGKKDSNGELNHLTTCKIVKEVMAQLGLNSPALVLPTVIRMKEEGKDVKVQKEFFGKMQEIVCKSSPPECFRTMPNLKVTLQWFKRLVKEYLELKGLEVSGSHAKILNVLKSGLSTNCVEDIPKAISKLLVENEKLLKIVEKVKRMLKCGVNTTLDEFEKELEFHTN